MLFDGSNIGGKVTKGEKGDQGIQGIQGTEGDTGETGAQGPQGDPGTPADPTITDSLQTQIDDLQAQVDALGGGGLIVAGGNVIFGQLRWSIGTEGTDSTERSLPIPRAGKIVALAIKPTSNSLDAAVQFTVRLNKADTPLQITVPAGSTSVHTIVLDVDVAAGDLVNLQADATAAGLGGTSFLATYEYQPE